MSEQFHKTEEFITKTIHLPELFAVDDEERKVSGEESKMKKRITSRRKMN